MSSPKSNLKRSLSSYSDGIGIPKKNIESPDAQSSVKRRLLDLLLSETLSDVHFIVGVDPETERIPAHRLILQMGSPVFRSMLDEVWLAKSSEIKVPDVGPSAFKALLRFLYTDDVQLSGDTVMSVLYAANKYDISPLRKSCCSFLGQNLSSENVFAIIAQAKLHDLKELEEQCLNVIDKKTEIAVLAESFLDITLKTLCLLLERDTLKISEIKLFEAVCRWSEAACVRRHLPVNSDNQKLVAGEALALIRYPLMPVEVFTARVVPLNLLAENEMLSLFTYFTSNLKPRTNFSDKPRAFGKFYTLKRFKVTTTVGFDYKNSRSDRIMFYSDRDIHLAGLGIFGSERGSPLSVSTSIINQDSLAEILNNEATFPKADKICRVNFKVPILLKANVPYLIKLIIKGSSSYYGEEGSRIVPMQVEQGGKFTITFIEPPPLLGNRNSSDNLRTVKEGQMPELIFYH